MCKRGVGPWPCDHREKHSQAAKKGHAGRIARVLPGLLSEYNMLGATGIGGRAKAPKVQRRLKQLSNRFNRYDKLQPGIVMSAWRGMGKKR